MPKVLKHVFKHFLFQKFFSPLQSFLFEEAIRQLSEFSYYRILDWKISKFCEIGKSKINLTKTKKKKKKKREREN